MKLFSFFLSLSLLLDICLPISIISQKNEYLISRISVESGLSQSSIYAMLQDSEGFMWFGTAEGLNKYDGYNFTVYRFDRSDPFSISDSWVTALLEDRNKTIWIGTASSGLNKYDKKSNKFYVYKHNDSDKNSLSNDVINTIVEDKENILWIGTEDGLNKFDPKHGTFTVYKNDPKNPYSISHNYINCIYEDGEGFLWIGTNGGGLNKYDKKKNIFYHYEKENNNKTGISNNSVYAIHEDPQNKNIIWLATYGGLNKFDKSAQKFSCLKQNPNNQNSISNDEIQSLFIDSKGNIWLGTHRNGLIKYDPKHNTFTHFLYDRNNINTISKNNILSIIEDNIGNIWIGTRGGGLSKLKKFKFPQYRFLSNTLDEVNTNNVWALFKDDQKRVWVGTDNGLIIYNRAKGSYVVYQNNPKNSNSISDNTISAILQDRNNVMWLGTESGGLNKFDESSNSFTRYQHDPKNPLSLPDNNVKSILEDNEGTLWIGTRGGGFSKFDPVKGIFKNYQHKDASNSLSHNRVNFIFEDKYHDLWICTSGGGINKFNKKTERFTHYTFDPSNPYSLSDIYVLSASEDKEGNLWICTYDGGMNKYDRKTGHFTRYRKENGLAGNVTYGSLIDESGNIWISTNNGISKFNPHNLTFRNYDEKDGLQDKEFNSGAFYKSKDGEMFFGGIDGFNSFIPENIYDNTFMSPVVIIGLKVLGRTVTFDKPLSQLKEINLSYKDNYFSFEYAGLDFSSPEKNQYAYKLEGFDNNWHKCGNRRLASYTNLDAGDYVFKVKCTNSDGVWNNNYAEIKITIVPPYWKTWWFRTMVVMALLFLIIIIYRIRINIYKTHNELLQKEINERCKIEEELINARNKAEESDRLKSNFLAQMSHEIRTPINTILSFTSLLKDELQDKVGYELKDSFNIIENGGRRLIRTIDLILKMSEVQAGKFNICFEEFDMMSDVLNPLSNEFRIAASKKKLNLNIICEANNTKLKADKYSVIKIFQNLIDNAIKYTNRGQVDVIVSNNDPNLLCVEVKDTGIGISPEYMDELFLPFSQEDTGYTRHFEGNGLGLSLVKNYIEINNATINVTSEKGKGTKFTVTFLNHL